MIVLVARGSVAFCRHERKSWGPSITDIVIHHLPVFTPELDALIAEINGLGGWESEFASMAIAQWQYELQQLERDSVDTGVSLNNLGFALRSERDR